MKEQAYKSIIRPSLEYACTVWDPYLQQDIYTIERVQSRAARFATNKYRNTSSVGNMLQYLEWRSLQDRRKDSRLNMFYKIVNNKVDYPKNRQTHSTKKADTIVKLNTEKNLFPQEQYL